MLRAYLILAVVSLLVGCLGVLFLFLALRRWRRCSQLRNHGITVGDRIIDKNVRGKPSWASYRVTPFSPVYSYFVTYTYEYEGKRYKCEQWVSANYYRAATFGDQVRLRCLLSHPGFSTLEGEEMRDSQLVGAAVGGIGLLGSALGLLFLLLSLVLH